MSLLFNAQMTQSTIVSLIFQNFFSVNRNKFDKIRLRKSSNYVPDYVVISHFGKTRLFIVFNATLSILSKRLWYYIVWPRLYKPFDNLLIATLNDASLSQSLKTAFNQYYAHLPELTYTDVIDLLTQCTRAYDYTQYYVADQMKQSELGRTCYQILSANLANHPQSFEWTMLLATEANRLDSLDPNWLTRSAALLRLCKDLPVHYYQKQMIQYGAVMQQLKHDTPGQTVLYECDNHGEFWFDCIVITWLLSQGCVVYLAAKAVPVANDVTRDDVIRLLDNPELHRLKQAVDSRHLYIISTGSRVTGRPAYQISDDYMTAYQAADIIWMKGQGNFSTTPMAHYRWGRLTWYDYKKPFVYLMVVKARLIQTYLTMINMPRNRGDLFIHRYYKETSYELQNRRR